jgi:acetyl-CoA carboxylase / biotin carboxylase 1
MRALGDKISSTIVAQSLGIPVIPWSGSGIIMNPADCFEPEKCEPIYQSAGISSLEEAVSKAEIIGFPLMIKASEGGGGKGIRKIMNLSEIKLAFEQVRKEVPGSPIFLMKLSQKSRHLEIQVVADQYGQALTLFGRDCSVQRRHQKIIEEAPISVIPEELAWKMERDAVTLAQSVRYESVGTVEYLYDIEQGKYYFLELNPRLQVEHPTTEMVSGVNIPATQLQIAMGIPLHLIRQIRSLWKQPENEKNNFELINETRSKPTGHVIAARITAENPDAGFKPNSGKLFELNFKSFPETWGYFSIAPSGGLHEYADSQFGHIFAYGQDRESARKNMVVALKELIIRGEFRTTVEYLIELLENNSFLANEFDTAWLDGLIASQNGPARRLPHEVSVIGGGAALAMCKFEKNEEDVVKALQNRGIPNPTLLASELNLQFIQDGFSYSCTAIKSSSHQLRLMFHPKSESVLISAKKMTDGGLLLNIDGKSHTAYVKSEGDNYRVTIDGKTCILESEQDPTTVKSPSPGKLVRYLVEDGNHVLAGTPVAEIEVMKMYIPLQCGESGRISFVKPAGSSIETGDLIGKKIVMNTFYVCFSHIVT